MLFRHSRPLTTYFLDLTYTLKNRILFRNLFRNLWTVKRFDMMFIRCRLFIFFWIWMPCVSSFKMSSIRSIKTRRYFQIFSRLCLFVKYFLNILHSSSSFDSPLCSNLFKVKSFFYFFSSSARNGSHLHTC